MQDFLRKSKLQIQILHLAIKNELFISRKKNCYNYI